MVTSRGNAERDTSFGKTAEAQKSTAGPLLGTSGVLPVVPPHFTAELHHRRPLPTHVSVRGGSVTGATDPIGSPVAAYWNRSLSDSFGAKLRGLIPWSAWSRFAASAVLCAHSTWYSSSSVLDLHFDLTVPARVIRVKWNRP
jgi:hypothetical protein